MKITKLNKSKKKDYFSSKFNERLYIDMRRSKGYTDELEKLTRDEAVNISITLKAAATKNEAKSNCLFTIWIFVR